MSTHRTEAFAGAAATGTISPKSATHVTVGPKEIVDFYYYPGAKVFQISCLMPFNEKSPRDLTELLLSKNLEVLNASTSVVMAGTTLKFSIFILSRDKFLTCDNLSETLSDAGCKSVVVEGGDEFLVDDTHFPVELTSGYRALILSKEAFQGTFSRLREIFGTGADVVIYTEGQSVGVRFASRVGKILGAKLSLYLDELIKLYETVGIGVPELVELDPAEPSAVVRLYDSIECAGMRSTGPYSQWVRGHLAGAASIVLGAQMVCTETACIANGAEYCEFTLTRTPELQRPGQGKASR